LIHEIDNGKHGLTLDSGVKGVDAKQMKADLDTPPPKIVSTVLPLLIFEKCIRENSRKAGTATIPFVGVAPSLGARRKVSGHRASVFQASFMGLVFCYGIVDLLKKVGNVI
jgi:hypothetical protein